MIKKYDIVIIGAGLGGLQCGAILSNKGFSVCVLEKNRFIGGTLQTFPRRGCDFSTGMHYIGSLDKGQMLHRIFKYFKLFDGIEYKRLNDDGFEIFNIAGKEYKYAQGFDAWRSQMHHYFPADKKAIDKYIARIKATVDAQDIYVLKEPGNDAVQNKDYLKVNAFREIQSLTTNKELQNVLGALNFVYAGDKETTPFYVHALINNYFINSSYRVVGKSDQVANALADTIQKNGGEVLTGKKASQFVFEGDKMVALETADGERFYAGDFISNVHPAATMDMLATGRIKKSFRNRMNKLPSTHSAFGLHLNLKKDSVKYFNYNYQYFKHGDVWFASAYNEKKWPEHYFLHTSPLTGNDEYVSCVGLLTHMRFEEVEQWAQLPINNRGKDYEAWKQEKSEKMIELVGQQFPEIKENIVAHTASTPLTYRDYIGTHDGSMYGTSRDYRNPMGSYVSPRTKIPNLYFTGQNLNLHGMLGVSLSSLLTCGEFVSLRELINEINNA
ncbi:MAG: NAD(P)/FAD-dependent oxidoreductase [Bacteroidales bacterium]|nr:NAD(P)/FAD-dependent oxidoreductase [Bacteroidales bacterium]